MGASGSGKRSRVTVPKTSDALRDLIAAHAARNQEMVEQREVAAAAKRAGKLESLASGKTEDDIKKEEEKETEPAEPDIIVPPAPTDEEVDEAKQEYEGKVKVIKDEVTRLQGEKTKLFQLLKQQQASNPTTTPRSPTASTGATAAGGGHSIDSRDSHRPQQTERDAQIPRRDPAMAPPGPVDDPRFRRGSASALAIAAAAEAVSAGMHMRIVGGAPAAAAPAQQQGIWPGPISRPSMMPGGWSR
jgi:hypothetical protein